MDGHRSWPSLVPFPVAHPCPAALSISLGIRMLWVTLRMGSLEVHHTLVLVFTPSCMAMPLWHCVNLPSWTPQVPGDSGASRAFPAIDRPMHGRGVMTGLIFALQHSSACFFEIS